MTNQQQCEAFLKTRQTLILSTQAQTGTLETSVAPCVLVDGVVYIFVSELAAHTQNLLWTIEHNSNLPDEKSILVSGLFVADESETEQLFARERITLQFVPTEILADETQYQTVLQKMAQQFGEVMSVLTSLPDFHLIALKPKKGGYVKGFGQAFAFNDCLCQDLTPITKK